MIDEGVNLIQHGKSGQDWSEVIISYLIFRLTINNHYVHRLILP